MLNKNSILCWQDESCPFVKLIYAIYLGRNILVLQCITTKGPNFVDTFFEANRYLYPFMTSEDANGTLELPSY